VPPSAKSLQKIRPILEERRGLARTRRQIKKRRNSQALAMKEERHRENANAVR
jgi:hypothetical protein